MNESQNSATKQGNTAQTTTVKTHNAASMPDTTYWALHGIGVLLIAISIIIVFTTKGAGRKEALAANQSEHGNNKHKHSTAG